VCVCVCVCVCVRVRVCVWSTIWQTASDELFKVTTLLPKFTLHTNWKS